MSTTEGEITTALKKTLEAVKKFGQTDAKSVAKETGRKYGRESSYLNKLTRMGFLVKQRVGRQTLFSVKPVELTILKLGGSAITKKDRVLTANLKAIQRLSLEISNALKFEKGPKRLVIVVGAGSFGHPLALRYGIGSTASPIETKEKVYGLAALKHALIQLMSIVVEELLQKGVPAFPIDPQHGIYQLTGEIDIGLLASLLNIGFVPVVCGATLIDSQKNVRIIGPDRTVYDLATRLNPSTVLFALDVDGVYTSYPFEDAELIEKLTIEDLEKLLLRPPKHIDVTGGMHAKIMEGFRMLRLGIDVILLNGLKPQLVEKALCGEKVRGTYIMS